ncbi:MAG: Crp/Fnr family transcriptional regulator [Bdellovibrionaceae bacterium]|jgi:CRP-like cAMP-binding protein|nr:Crp/Fnr family transcriptional regulator [Pseudobdellovibrionaceae bacterium]
MNLYDSVRHSELEDASLTNRDLDTYRSCKTCPTCSNSIFRDTGDSFQLELQGNKTPQAFKKGQTLFVEGGPSFGMYCIGEGNIKVSKLSPDGKESIVRIASQGSLLGHRSVFANEPYMASAISIADSKVCFLDKEHVLDMVEKQPGVALRILKVIAKDLGVSENKLADFSQKNVRERVAGLLIYLSQNFGNQTDDGLRLEIKLTRDEMASIVGTATETLIRFLSEFKEEGLIVQDKKIIIIKNMAQLETYSQGEV